MTTADVSTRLVAVGEREYDRRLSFEEVAEARRLWAEDPVAAMLSPERAAFRGRGATRTRLETYAGAAVRHVNLLPPDRRPGTWEPSLARENAFRLATEWPEDEFEAPRFLLLGRRVVRAFAAENGYVEFGSIVLAWGRPCLALPHPSGRSRWWNAEGRTELVAWWVAVFSQCFSS